MIYVWITIAVAMAILEISTAQLVSIWFMLGAIASAVTACFTDNILIQVMVFIAVTVLALIATRPFVKKITKFKTEKTNSDRYIGKTGIVKEKIDNIAGRGQVNVSGSIWTARSADGSVIEKDENILVEAIEGVKLIVSRVKE